jgi:hypothetical protein
LANIGTTNGHRHNFGPGSLDRSAGLIKVFVFTRANQQARMKYTLPYI